MKEIIYKEICYALLRTDEVHPIVHCRHDLNWYPEIRLTLLGTIDFRPTVRSVVTENPYIVSCYECGNVRVWKDGDWVKPKINTFGTSVHIIMDDIFEIDQSIPNIAKEVIEKILNKI
jgi:hypothetical protein